MIFKNTDAWYGKIMSGMASQGKEKQPAHSGSVSHCHGQVSLSPPAPEHPTQHGLLPERDSKPSPSSRKFIFRKQTAQIKF